MVIIYHSRDLDGYCSGAICKKKFPEATLVGYDYGQPIPYDKIPEMESVIMVDVSLPMDEMLKLLEWSGDFTWIDHHASAIKDYEESKPLWPDYAETRFKAVLQDGVAACEGTWKYLFPNETIPQAVELLGMYDTWRKDDIHDWDQKIYPFQMGMRINITSADSFPQIMLENYSRSFINNTIEIGHTIVAYQTKQNELACKGAFEISFLGYKAICVNGGGFNSQAFDSVYNPDKHDLMMPFKFNGKSWTFSLYTTKADVDCSALAKSMGGGGHRQAAGFQVTGLPSFLFTEAYELLLATTRNLGHPAYGHSSSTTDAIDYLRDQAFDYLGIPKE